MNTWEQQSWLGATLESLTEVNAEVLCLLRAQSLVEGGQTSLLRALRKPLLELDASALRRAAGSGVLLVDAGFAAGTRWSEALIGAVQEPPPTGARRFFTVDGAMGVMRLVMAHAWHLARAEPAAARLLLGLSARKVTVIGGCTLSRLLQVAEDRAQWLRPRWENRPTIWCDLLRTAAEGQTDALERLRVRALQLLAADAQQG